MKQTIKNILRKLFLTFYDNFIFEQWQIYIRENRNILNFNNMNRFQRIPTPNGHFYADPFIFKFNDRNYMFYEDYDFIKDKGSIACIELTCDGKPVEKHIVLEKEYHLSFPFIFQYNEDIYMIPETLQSKRIELYRANKFPYNWSFEKVLIDEIPCVDTNILYYNNKYWLFTCVINRDYNKDLYLFYSNNPLENWSKHKNNPIISDITNARPAGNAFIYDKKIIRPSQDCGKRYGYALNFNVIDILNENEYCEKQLYKLNPNWRFNNLNNHTYNFNKDFEVIDGLRLQFDILKPIRKYNQKKIKYSKKDLD